VTTVTSLSTQPPIEHPSSRRRDELAAFLKACRGRITPEAVGLPPGPRRRTPGLRREEVAQLAGVGVTWYTWLEQGRPINASEQVIEAIARTLRLDGAEREHLYRLAELAVTCTRTTSSLPDQVEQVLAAMNPLPASVINARWDVLAANDTYSTIFPGVFPRPGQPEAYPRNVLWCSFTTPDCCNPYVNREDDQPRIVALLRANYGQHVGEPSWERFIADLSAASPRFAQLWQRQEVAASGSMVKRFRHASAGELVMTSTSFAVLSTPGARMVTYVPADDVTRERIAWLREHPDAPPTLHQH
jgi:transcriptional regulator with XRE-family HTH domain